MMDQDRIDRLITAAYSSTERGRGSVQRVQRQTGLSYSQIYRRAQNLGVISKQVKRQPEWTEAELELLEKYAHNNPVNIAMLLTRHGFPRRTPTAIKIRINRIGLSVEQSRIDGGIYSCRRAAECLGVANHVVAGYIEKGWLAASRDTDAENNRYTITDKALKALLVNHTAAIDFKKIDKFWLVDLFTNVK